MTRKQLAALFFSSLIPWISASMLFSLLPLHARQLGADETVIGFYMASAFMATTLGTIAAGWLASRLGRRKHLLIGAALLSIPAFALMTRATDLLQLTLTTDLVWFLIGSETALINILTGLFAGETVRGRTFGFIAITNSLAGLIGGLTGGRIVDAWGMPALIALGAVYQVLLIPIASFLVDRPGPVKISLRRTTPALPGLGLSFTLLLLANIVAWIALLFSALGRPLVMDNRGFDATAISSVVAVTGLLGLPTPFVLGWLSDRFGRKPVIIFGYCVGALGLVLLSQATAFWHFWFSAYVGSGIRASGTTVGSAYITDLVPPEALDTALARYNASNWIGSFIGLSGAGVIMQTIGMTPTFLLGAFFPLIAVGLLIPVRGARRRPTVDPVLPLGSPPL